ncbi:transposase [Pseudoduganella sp. LjRoot289]|uniref:DUF4351 domain-containing protein n=1 Tax=Pseudoduganella sp. LjRoot289 TaxID=3342314 RepID=UPI003ECE1E18
MDPPTDDYDTPWKTAVMRYFREFMAFYFPQVHDAIDWRLGYSFLDQELAQLVHDARLGRRRLDKLVQVSSNEGDAKLLYIHLEIQRSREKDFAKRIFTYHYRLYDRFDCPITTLVVLADPHAGWRPDWFGYAEFGCEIGFHFPTVKLMDYWPRLERLLQQENAFALLTAAHLMTLHTRGQHRRRFEFKTRLIDLLYARNWDAQRIFDLFDVLDWMMTIPPGLQDELAARIDELNRSREMPFENLMMRVAKDAARKEGLEEGRRKVLRRQLQLRFGPLPESVEQRVDRAEPGELTAWEERILQAATLDDVIGAG